MSSVPARPKWRPWLIDVVAGGLIGGFVGLIAAWNLMIYLGVESGYEASLGEVFGHSLLAGILVTAALVAGPVAGIWVARRQRRKRDVREKVSRSSAD
ncbi:MAG TPA: hypothetical protein VF115_03520 [Acidimicrobiia bacterium]